MNEEVAWCEIENAGYMADLDLWTGLCGPRRGSCSPAPGPGAPTVLELGAGVGRVSIRLGELGADVWALDTEQELLDEVVRRASSMGIETITPIRGDARFGGSLGRRFDLVIAPQVFVQLFEARADRVAIMGCGGPHPAPPGGAAPPRP